MSEQNDNKIVAWAFYNKDGRLRFIIDDEKRMEAWKSAHEGTIVPLVALNISEKNVDLS